MHHLHVCCVETGTAACRYLQYPLLKSLLHKHLHRDDHVLVPGPAFEVQNKLQSYIDADITLASHSAGCGLSLLPEDMAADGYRFLQAVDYSETCIQVRSRSCCLSRHNIVLSCCAQVKPQSSAQACCCRPCKPEQLKSIKTWSLTALWMSQLCSCRCETPKLMHIHCSTSICCKISSNLHMP